MNETGKRRLKWFLGIGGLVIFLYLCFAVFVYLVSRTSVFWIDLILGLLIYTALFYGFLYNKTRKGIEEKVMTELGFPRTAGTLDGILIMAEFKMARRGSPWVKDIYSGTIKGLPTQIVLFSITIGTGKNSTSYNHIGIIFTSNRSHLPVQIYDKQNPLDFVLANDLRTLESNEFNNMFSVYSEDSKNPYYQLDTDSMAELLDYRQQLKYPINMEFCNNKILFYTGIEFYTSQLNSMLSFSEVFNNSPKESSISDCKKALQQFIDVGQKLSEIMDIRLEK